MESNHAIEKLSDDLESTGEFADVTFLVEGEQVLAHRNLLGSRSQYFRAMLFGGLAESQLKKIELDVKLKPFKQILSYIYTGRLELGKLDDGDFIDLLLLAHQYQIENVQTAVVKNLQNKLSLENLCWLYNMAVTYDLKELLADCEIFAFDNGASLVKHKSLTMLAEPALEAFLKLFRVPEIDKFMAVKAWCEQNPMIDPKGILAYVEYSNISIEDLVRKVKPTGLVKCKELLRIIEAKFDVTKLPLTHDTCILHRFHTVKGIPFTTDAYIDLKRQYLICCFIVFCNQRFKHITEFSSDTVNWTRMHNEITEITHTHIRFKMFVEARYLRFTGLPTARCFIGLIDI